MRLRFASSPVVLGILALMLAAGGCRVQERYLVDRQALLGLAAQADAERERRVVPAVRERDGARVGLRGDFVPLAPSAWVSDPVSVRTSARSPMVTAGAVLTVVGSILSVTNTTLWLTSRNTGNDGFANATLGLTIAAEPIMITGTVLWILGALSRPQEAALPAP